MEAIKGEVTIAKLGARFEVHPNQIHKWKKILTDGVIVIFGKDQWQKKRDKTNLIAQLYQQIG